MALAFITHIRMSSGGTKDEHISHVKWHDPADGRDVSSTVKEMVDLIENKSVQAFVMVNAKAILVGVVDHKYIRTHADGVWSNNLLALPRY